MADPATKPSAKVDPPYSKDYFGAHGEPDVWDTTVMFTPQDITNALQDADAGNLQAAADICDAQWRGDDRIRGTLQTRVDALLGLNNDEKLEFSVDNDRKRIEKAIKEDWWISAPEPELKKLIRWGYHLGIGFAQRKTVPHKGRWVPRLSTWHPRHFTKDYTTGLWKVYTKEGETLIIRPDDPRWVTFTPYGESRPWADGSWLPSGFWWLVKLYGTRDWQKHNALHGGGALMGTAPKDSSDPDRRKFWTDLKSLGRNARIVFPEGYSIEALQAATNAWETFSKAIEAANTAIAIVHLGQPMTTEVPKNAQTGADNARAVRQDYMEFDAENLATWAHDVHLPAWAAWNFGDALLAPWPRYNAAPPINLQVEASTLGALGTALEKLDEMAHKAGLKVDIPTMLYRHNVPTLELTKAEKEAVEKAQEPAGPPPQPPKEPRWSACS